MLIRTKFYFQPKPFFPKVAYVKQQILHVYLTSSKYLNFNMLKKKRRKILDSPAPNSTFSQLSPVQQMVPHSQNCLNTLWINPRYFFNCCHFYFQNLCRIHLFLSFSAAPVLIPAQTITMALWLVFRLSLLPPQSVYSPHCRQKDLFKIEITLHQSLHFSMLPINRIHYTLKSLTWPTGPCTM